MKKHRIALRVIDLINGLYAEVASVYGRLRRALHDARITHFEFRITFDVLLAEYGHTGILLAN